MPKRIEIDGKFYRTRKGKLVEIPPQWVGSTTNPQTIRKRRSKQSSDAREMPSHPLKSGSWPNKDYRKKRYDHD